MDSVMCCVQFLQIAFKELKDMFRLISKSVNCRALDKEQHPAMVQS
jgi:hypothetical protein